MENIVELTKQEIIEEVRRTGVLRERHLSAAAINFIRSYDCDESATDDLLAEKHLLAFLKRELEISEKYPAEDLEIINLVYESSIKTLIVNDGYLEMFANHSIIHHRSDRTYPYSPDRYVAVHIERVIAAHDNQYLNPENLTEPEENEIYIASLSRFKFHYESDLRTVSTTNEYYQDRHWVGTLTLKRPKPVAQNIVRTAIGKLDMTYLSETGAEIIKYIADYNQFTDYDRFLQIQGVLHLLERRFLEYLKEPEFAEEIEQLKAEEIEQLKMDTLRIQAFKEASADVDQIIVPGGEILVFSDRSVLVALEAEEPEFHLDIYQFIMESLGNLRRSYFSRNEDFEPDSYSVSNEFEKYGLSFSFRNGRVITKFTKKFKDRLFNAANIRLV